MIFRVTHNAIRSMRNWCIVMLVKPGIQQPTREKKLFHPSTLKGREQRSNVLKKTILPLKLEGNRRRVTCCCLRAGELLLLARIWESFISAKNLCDLFTIRPFRTRAAKSIPQAIWGLTRHQHQIDRFSRSIVRKASSFTSSISAKKKKHGHTQTHTYRQTSVSSADPWCFVHCLRERHICFFFL